MHSPAMKTVTVENVEAVIEKEVKRERVTGLKAFEGRKVTIIVVAEEGSG